MIFEIIGKIVFSIFVLIGLFEVGIFVIRKTVDKSAIYNAYWQYLKQKKREERND